LRLIGNFIEDGVRAIKKLRSPVLPVGIFLTATLSFILSRDKNIASWLQPRLEPLSELLLVGPDCLYAFISLFIFPLFFLLVVRENPKNYGLSLGNVKLAVPVFVMLLTGLTLFGYVVAGMDAFKRFYPPVPADSRNYFVLFLTYFLFMWGWEFLNRGFLLLGLKRYVGVYAVYIQLIPFVILHLGKPSFELYGSILFGLFFGFYAYLVDSFIYGAIAHAYFAFVCRLIISSG